MDDKDEHEPNAVGDDQSAIENEEQPDTDSEDREDSSVEVEISDESSADDVQENVSREEAVEAEADEEVETESERFIRLAAEFDNYKKRTAREFENIIKRANERLLRDLVDIVDNFERALSAETGEHDSGAYRKGVELIYNQLSALLAKEGISPIESVGRPFDPTYHEAVMQMESDEYDEGVVAQEVQKGYKIDGKVLRHARVIVSAGPAGDKSEQDSETNE